LRYRRVEAATKTSAQP